MLETMPAAHAAAFWTGLHLILLLTLFRSGGQPAAQSTSVALGDGGDPQLTRAVRAFGNATEYVPTGLIALGVLALVGAAPAMDACGRLGPLRRPGHARGQPLATAAAPRFRPRRRGDDDLGGLCVRPWPPLSPCCFRRHPLSLLRPHRVGHIRRHGRKPAERRRRRRAEGGRRCGRGRRRRAPRPVDLRARPGALEEVEREESRDLGLRVFIGQRQATVSGSDISAEARAKLIARAVAMARLAPEDPYAGLAESKPAGARPLRRSRHLRSATEPTPETLEDRARIAEAASRGFEGVTNTDGASSSSSSSIWRMVTSAGFSGVHQASGFSIGASAIAGAEGGMETGYEGRSVRWQSDLPDPQRIGAEAGRRAVGRLGARKIASTTAPVIFENRLAASLMSPLIGAISGPSIARGASFLKDKLGQQIFAKGINIGDDPHKPARPGLLALRRRGRGQQRHPHHRRRRPDHLADEHGFRPPVGP
jgi:uncharacterized membrane protein YecN with MAPEG domain